MSKPNKHLAIFIFLATTLLMSLASGYQYVGDFIEKALNSLGMFFTYFVLVALFAIYKGVKLFTPKQLYFLAFTTLVLTLASYVYPVFKYWEQDANDFLSTFLYDLILNVIIFTLLIKEAKRERSKINS